MNRELVNPDDPELTAYALGELSAAEKAEFEVRLQSSPGAQSELESMSEIMSMLSTGLSKEWECEMTSPDSISIGKQFNPDDPELTAYALGELNAAEKAEFEVRLESSPVAQSELDSMSDIMSMLSTGLKSELECELAPPVLQLVEDDVETAALREKVIEPTTFRESRRVLGAIAAAVALMLVAVGVSSIPQVGSQMASNAVVASAPVNSVDHSPAVHVPRLFLADEIDDVEALALADTFVGENGNAGIDATYLESVSIVPASYSPALNSGPRVDSYLPPVQSGKNKSSKLDLRKGKTFAAKNSNASGVFVRGYVAMDGGAKDSGYSLAGFHPVAMSGNPVVETDLQILAQMRALQKELAGVVSTMPEGSAERANLEKILKDSRSIGNELKREFSR